jgi:hypothetical protein
MYASSSGPRSGRSISRLTFVLACLVLVTIPLGVAAARQLSSNGSSPATGHAQVVTQGVATINADRIVWRLVERTARPRWAANPSRRAISFIFASEEPVLLSAVTENGLKDIARLATGEAMMVPGNLRTVRASFTGKSTKYLSLELVPAEDADSVGSGKLLFKSRSFSSPSGERDIDLVRNVLAIGESATVPDSGQNNVVLATEGAIDVLPHNGRATRLEAGESGTFRGDLQIKAVQPTSANAVPVSALTAYMAQVQSARASYVVAVIGAEIPPPITPSPTTTQTPTPEASPSTSSATGPVATATSTLLPGAPTTVPTRLPNVQPPTDTPTQGPIPLTNTPIRVPPTDTPARPTNTPVPPTDTLLPPTDTPVRPTATPTKIPPPRGLDSDGDDLPDIVEVHLGTNRLNPDTDGDGCWDGFEAHHHRYDPLNPNDCSPTDDD